MFLAISFVSKDDSDGQESKMKGYLRSITMAITCLTHTADSKGNPNKLHEELSKLPESIPETLEEFYERTGPDGLLVGRMMDKVSEGFERFCSETGRSDDTHETAQMNVDESTEGSSPEKQC